MKCFSGIDNQNNLLPKPKLPTPSFGIDNIENSSQTSVFKNPFSEAEISKEAALQKHVKMVENKDNVITINGKKICWNYRKGRCRFGHNCKFAHDSDIELTKDLLDNKHVNQVENIKDRPQNEPLNHTFLAPNEREIDDNSPLRKKAKRPGLTQGLIPGKKVMKQYVKNQKK